MNSKQVDLLNVGLIILSLILAFKIPFELFIIVYAFLGPLHYITEIDWLNKKSYFVKKRNWIWIFFLVGLLISLPAMFRVDQLKNWGMSETLLTIRNKVSALSPYMILFSLIFAIGLTILKKFLHLLLFLLGSMLLTYLAISYLSWTSLFASLFIPTVIHVYIFTLLFMIFGTLQSKNRAGWIAIVFMLLVPFIVIGSEMTLDNVDPSESVKAIFMQTGMSHVNATLAQLFGLTENGNFLLVSLAGLKIEVFIAFAYTYHYLNWFSKTSIIGWGKHINKNKLIVIIVVWLLSVGLYLYDYKTGIIALMFLSYLHVILEFPLNIACIRSLFNHIFRPNLKA
jgi:hypothetical protein